MKFGVAAVKEAGFAGAGAGSACTSIVAWMYGFGLMTTFEGFVGPAAAALLPPLRLLRRISEDEAVVGRDLDKDKDEDEDSREQGWPAKRDAKEWGCV